MQFLDSTTKKIVFVVALVLLILGIIFFSPQNKTLSMTIPGTSFTVNHNLLAGETFTYGDQQSSPQAGFGSVTVIEKYTRKLSDDSFVTMLAINSGGPGEECYLAYFVRQGNTYQMTDSVLLGDRIKMQGLTVQGNTIVANYLDHAPDQVMVDKPTVSVTKSFIFTSGKLQEQ